MRRSHEDAIKAFFMGLRKGVVMRWLHIFCFIVLSTMGCGTIMQGGTESLGVSSNPSGAHVIINNEHKGQTPLTVELKRKENHVIELHKDGYESASETVTHNVSGWVWGNLLFGGVIGLAVDSIAGGMYKLSADTVHVDLVKHKQSKGTLAGNPPAYQPPLIIKPKKIAPSADRTVSQPGILKTEDAAGSSEDYEVEHTHPVIKEKPIPKPTIQKTITAPPKNAETYFWEGVVYSKTKQYNKAIWAYKAAIKLDPIYAEAHYNLAVVYKKKGLNNLAQVHAGKAAEYQPDMEKAYKLLDELQQRQR